MGLFGKIAGGVVGGAMNLLGGAISDSRSAKASQASWNANYNAQKEFAQNSIQWRVQDAKKAGINPYAVVGGQSVGYTPQDISRTQDFATGVSRAGNILSDTLGQIQLATAKEDLKSKQLDNSKKSVELANAVIKKNMGQVPKTMTDVVQGTSGSDLVTAGDGRQFLIPKNDASLDSLSGLKQGVLSMYDRESHSALAKENKHDLALGMLGYETLPKNIKGVYSRAMREASDIAGNSGEFMGALSIISSLLKQGLGFITSHKLLKGGKK